MKIQLLGLLNVILRSQRLAGLHAGDTLIKAGRDSHYYSMKFKKKGQCISCTENHKSKSPLLTSYLHM